MTTRLLCITLGLSIPMLGSVATAEGMPQQIWYQGRLLDPSGQPVQAAPSMKFEIFDAPENGTSLWSDTLNVGIVAGFYAIALGSTSGNPLPLTLFNGGTRYLEISVGAAKLSPRQALGSVPYALRAQELANGKAPLFVEAETATQTRGLGTTEADPTASGGMRYIVRGSLATGGRAWGMANAELNKLGIVSWGMQARAVTARIKVTNNGSNSALASFVCTAYRGGTWVNLASVSVVPSALPQNEWTGIRLTCNWNPDDGDTFVGFDSFATGITDLAVDWVESLRQTTNIVSGSIQPPQWSYSAKGPVAGWTSLWGGTIILPGDSLVTLSLMGHWTVDKPNCYATILVDGAPISSPGDASAPPWGATLIAESGLGVWTPIGFSVSMSMGAGRHALATAVIPSDGTTCTVNGARIYYGAVAR
jgi:hypothetical protein